MINKRIMLLTVICFIILGSIGAYFFYKIQNYLGL